MSRNLPPIALSVRQPWAWAVVVGAKTIENRSQSAIRAGRMVPGRICIHAAMGLKEDEYRWAVWRLQRHGVTCPDPLDLVRGAIIGTVEVTGIVTASDSPWFGGTTGLALRDAKQIEPIPCPGALGYFRWSPADTTPPEPRWMRRWNAPKGDGATEALRDDGDFRLGKRIGRRGLINGADWSYVSEREEKGP